MEPAIEARVCRATQKHGRRFEMAENSGGNGGLYFIVGALVVVGAVMFVVLSGHPSPTASGRGQTQVDTPHAQLDLPQPPVLKVKYQSRICSPVQNKTPSCLAA